MINSLVKNLTRDKQMPRDLTQVNCLKVTNTIKFPQIWQLNCLKMTNDNYIPTDLTSKLS